MARTLGDVLHLFLDDADAPADDRRAAPEAPAEEAAPADRIVWVPLQLDDPRSLRSLGGWCDELEGAGRRVEVVSPLGAAPDAWRAATAPRRDRAILARDGASYARALGDVGRRSDADCVLARIPFAWVDGLPSGAASRILIGPDTIEADAAGNAAARWAARHPAAMIALDGAPPEAAARVGQSLERRGLHPHWLRSARARARWLAPAHGDAQAL